MPVRKEKPMMSTAESSPAHSPSPQSSQSRVEVEEVTTIVKSPLLRPTPAFLKVIHYGGGEGETFTMGEILDYVKKYIDDKKLYDQQNPRIIYCKGNDLGAAFNVDQITIPEVLKVFLKHCTQEKDSRFKISRQVSTRPLCEDQSTSSLSASSSMSSSLSSPSKPTSQDTTVRLPSVAPISSLSSSSSHLPSSSPVVSSSTSISECNSSLKEARYAGSIPRSIPPACPSTVVTRMEMEKSKQDDDSCPPSTSFSVSAMDETDGGIPWCCQVEVDNNIEDTGNHDSLVVEYSSDNFSVEYELVSSSEAESYNLGDTEESRSPSESTPATAFYLVCEESDIEYLADYSDTDSDSDAELGEEDKWECNMCQFKNSALYRNCGKCWSLRPDWLPPSSSSEVEGAKESCASPGSFAISSQDSAIGSMACSQEQVDSAVDSNKKDIDLKKDDTTGLDVPVTKLNSNRKRSHSSCLSDSQEELVGKTKVSKITQGNCGKEGKDPSPKDPCVICLTRPKTACIIHGKTGHQVCCYACARMLKKKRKSCPICRRPIQRVVRNYF